MISIQIGQVRCTTFSPIDVNKFFTFHFQCCTLRHIIHRKVIGIHDNSEPIQKNKKRINDCLTSEANAPNTYENSLMVKIRSRGDITKKQVSFHSRQPKQRIVSTLEVRMVNVSFMPEIQFKDGLQNNENFMCTDEIYRSDVIFVPETLSKDETQVTEKCLRRIVTRSPFAFGN